MDQSNLVDMNALKENLKKKGYKLTPQRRSIVDVIIENEGKHLTAEEIYDEVKKKCPEIGLATVYRTILLLEELNIISRLIHSNETHRHHHLICNVCNKVLEVKDDLLDDLEIDIEKEYKFKILDHSLKFYGLCEECQKNLKEE